MYTITIEARYREYMRDSFGNPVNRRLFFADLDLIDLETQIIEKKGPLFKKYNALLADLVRACFLIYLC
jgi:hypothetical protein